MTSTTFDKGYRTYQWHCSCETNSNRRFGKMIENVCWLQICIFAKSNKTMLLLQILDLFDAAPVTYWSRHRDRTPKCSAFCRCIHYRNGYNGLFRIDTRMACFSPREWSVVATYSTREIGSHLLIHLPMMTASHSTFVRTSGR